MAGTVTTFLQNLLKSVTTYYTATYSADTDLYQILRMYGAELSSGSTSLENVRNNAFVVTCENSKLFDNFGTYFSQLKTGDQDYDEDLYTSGSANHTIGPTAITLSRKTTTTFVTNWLNVSTVFPYDFLLGYTALPASQPRYGHTLHQTATIGNKLYASCYIKDSGVVSYPRIVSYDTSTNTWGVFNTLLTDTAGSIWITLGYPILPFMGLISYRPYLGHGTYNTFEYLYGFDILPSEYAAGLGYGRLDLVGVKYANLNTTPTYTSGSSSIVRIVNSANISFTESVEFHNKIYMAISMVSDVPDTSYRRPHLVYYDTALDNTGEAGLSVAISGINYDFDVFTSVVYNNKIYIIVRYNSTTHLMISYDGISWNIALTSPATGTEVVRNTIVYNNDLYAIVYGKTTNNSKIYKYNSSLNTWTLQYTFSNLSSYKFFVFKNYLIISTSQGYIYYLDTNDDTWKVHSQLTVVGNRSISQFEIINNTLYGMVPFDTNSWSSNNFITSNIYEYYYYTGDKKTFDTNERMSIPSYRKQLDFLLESAMTGGTVLGMTRAVNAFTLVNPDIRELYRYPGWKLKEGSGSVTKLSINTWRFNNVPAWKYNLWKGAHVTFTSGSAIGEKFASGYIVLISDNNVVTTGAIYNNNLLYDFNRP